MINLEAYLIPTMESAQYAIGDINNIFRPLLQKSLTAEEYKKLIEQIEMDTKEIATFMKDDAKNFCKNITQLDKPDNNEEALKLMISEITNFANSYIKSANFTKYYKNYKQILDIRVKQEKSYDKRFDTELHVTLFGWNEYQAQYKFNNSLKKLLKDKIDDRKISTLSKLVNPYGFSSPIYNSFIRNFESVIITFIKTRFKNWYGDILASDYTAYGDHRILVRFNMNNESGNSIKDQETLVKEAGKYFTDTMKKFNIAEGNKTYKTNYNTAENWFIIRFRYYDENYSGSGSDYDNGLNKSNKAENEKIEKVIYDTIREVKKKYQNIRIDNQSYRGHGEIYLSIN